jgi:predicted secreted Zn-dependent protease
MKKLFRRIVKFYFELRQIVWEVKKEFIQSRKIIQDDISHISEGNLRSRNISITYRKSIFFKPDIESMYDDCLSRLKRNDLNHRDITELHRRAMDTTIKLLEIIPNDVYMENWFNKQ